MHHNSRNKYTLQFGFLSPFGICIFLVRSDHSTFLSITVQMPHCYCFTDIGQNVKMQSKKTNTRIENKELAINIQFEGDHRLSFLLVLVTSFKKPLIITSLLWLNSTQERGLLSALINLSIKQMLHFQDTVFFYPKKTRKLIYGNKHLCKLLIWKHF